MTKDEALRLALEALESITSVSICEATHHPKKDRHLLCEECPNEVRHLKAITAIKAALEAKDEPDAYGYAKRLAEAIWSKHYKTIAPQWEPFDELIGVLTQIDNMTSGLIFPPQKEAKDEPVAWVNLDDLYDLEAGEDGDVPYVVRGNEQPKNMPKSIPLYTIPPQRKPLTDEEIASIYMNHTDRPMHAQWDFARAIEAKLKEKNCSL